MSFQEWHSQTLVSAVVSYKLTHIKLYKNIPIRKCQHEQDQSIFVSNFHLKIQKAVSKRFCALILLLNLAQPQWMSVMCDAPLVRDILCVLPFTHPASNATLLRTSLLVFDTQCIIVNETCFVFLWKSKKDIVFQNIWKLGTSFEIEALTFLFKAISGTLPTIFSFSLRYLYGLELKFNTLHFKKFETPKPETKGHYVITKEPSIFNNKSRNVLHCKNNTFLASKFVCMYWKDCTTKQDAIHDECSQLSSTKRDDMRDRHHIRPPKCPALLSTKIDASCQLVMPYDNATQNSEEQLSDINTFDRSPEIWDLMELSSYCKAQGLVLCSEENQRCFNISDICVYKFDFAGNFVPCQSGEHMQECTEFQCNMMLKCPRFYCIPWSNVCNGKWDCPGGYDEGRTCNNTARCQNMFHCQNSAQCIHIGDVCDGQKDCIQNDDEALCELRNAMCPGVCKCLLFAINCLYAKGIFLKQDAALPYSVVRLQNCTFQFAFRLLQIMKSVTELSVINCGVQMMCHSFLLGLALVKFKFSKNNMSTVLDCCFLNSYGLKEITLTSNMISVIERNAFSHLPVLGFLDLSQNALLQIPFVPVGLMGFLVTGNPLNGPSSHVRNIFYSFVLLTDNYPLCCTVGSNVICLSISQQNFCYFLLDNYLNAWLFLAFFLCSLATNVVCFRKTKKDSQTHRNFKNIVFCITTVNFIGSSTLLILSTSSYTFDSEFLFHEQRWKGGPVCLSVFILTSIFNISSPLLLFVLSFCRLMIVLCPLNPKYKQVKFASKQIVSIVLFSLVVSSVCALYMLSSKFALPSKMCSPFFDTISSAGLMRFTSQGIVALHVITSAATVFDYIYLQVELNKSQRNLQKSSAPHLLSSSTMKRTISFSVSSLISWIPSSVLYLTCLYINACPARIMLWTTLFSTTIAATLNPIILIIFQ